MPDDAPAGSVQWLATGERGASSEALFTRLSGIPASHGIRKAVDHPYGPDDLRRCRLMLEAVPSLQVKLHEAADLSPQWAELIKDWVGLTALMDEECPDWREAIVQKAPFTYTRMRNLLGRAPQPT